MANLWSDELVDYISRTTKPILMGDEYAMTYQPKYERYLDNGDMFYVTFYEDNISNHADYIDIQLQNLTSNDFAMYLGLTNFSSRIDRFNRDFGMKVELYEGINFTSGTGSTSNLSVYNANRESVETPNFTVEVNPSFIDDATATLLKVWYPTNSCIQLDKGIIRLDTTLDGTYQNYTLKVSVDNNNAMSYGGTIWIAQPRFIEE
jgi:hypothetical protein